MCIQLRPRRCFWLVISTLPSALCETKEIVKLHLQFLQFLVFFIPQGCSLIFFLTLVNVISKPDPNAPTINTSEELVQYLKRPPWDYTGDESFNVFLVVFHGYCFYDAFNRGDFEGFSVFAFLPQLAVCVIIQIFAKLRGNVSTWMCILTFVDFFSFSYSEVLRFLRRVV